MAKRRRNKNKSGLPQNVLDRARQNAGEMDEGNGEAASVSERAARRRNASNVQLERTRQRGELTSEMIEDVLAHPTKFVSAEELQEEYQHVLVDLRNMGILAAVLIVALLGLNVVL